jgi:nitrite reductase/ring-hydroxylating ferredoxin subunit
MPQFVKIATRAELPERDEAKEFTVGDKVICIANINGTYAAVDNVCSHRGGPLGQGVVMDGKLICPWHGWQYDVTTGAPAQNPQLKVAVYRLKLEGDDVLVEI